MPPRGSRYVVYDERSTVPLFPVADFVDPLNEVVAGGALRYTVGSLVRGFVPDAFGGDTNAGAFTRAPRKTVGPLLLALPSVFGGAVITGVSGRDPPRKIVGPSFFVFPSVFGGVAITGVSGRAPPRLIVGPFPFERV
jgi:hypothetical protein